MQMAKRDLLWVNSVTNLRIYSAPCDCLAGLRYLQHALHAQAKPDIFRACRRIHCTFMSQQHLQLYRPCVNSGRGMPEQSVVPCNA